MKHASQVPTESLHLRIRHLGFDPDHLTTAEQKELLDIEEIFSSRQEQAAEYQDSVGLQPLLVSP